VVSVVAIVSALFCLKRYGAIVPARAAGRVYVGATALTAATALGIFKHGGFGAAHALAVATLAVLAFGLLTARLSWFGGLNRAVQTASFSATLLFHAIPGITEALTRLPVGSPVFSSAKVPQFKVIYALLVLLFVVGLAFQLHRLRGKGEA
jgi:hypothetical protein